MKPRVIIAGILNTKGKELRYIADCVRDAGGTPIVMELSVGGESKEDWVDIRLREVLASDGLTPEDVFRMNRQDGAAAVAKAGGVYIQKMYEAGGLDGIISFAGGVGTSVCSTVMRALPLGVPKLMVSSVACMHFTGTYIGGKDLCMMYPLFEIGTSTLSKQILRNAAYGIVGMASAPRDDKTQKRPPAIAASALGITTPAVLSGAKLLEDAGYESMIVHVNGTGGKTLEELAEKHEVDGVLELTPFEVVGNIYHTHSDAGPDRMTAAARCGVPQVIAPGAFDTIIFEKDNLPDHIAKEIEDGVRGRELNRHQPNVIVPGTTLEEMDLFAKTLAKKVNNATAPCAFLIPMKGFSGYDMGVENLDLGWAGPGPTPAWLPVEDGSLYSARAVRFLQTLVDSLDFSNPNLEVYSVDRHFNEDDFGRLSGEILYDMMNGKWVKGAMADKYEWVKKAQ